jgi:hypothetical protein
MLGWADRKPSIVLHCKDIEAIYRELFARGVQSTELPKKMA